MEISLNGEDFSNDGRTFGFYDPFVLNVSPKLISKSGSTKVAVSGFGFVDTTSDNQLKTKFESSYGELDCSAGCTEPANYDSKHQIISTTPAYNEVKRNGQYLSPEEPLEVEVSVFGDKFTDNNIQVFYYDEPDFRNLNTGGVPANGQDPILIETDFKLDRNPKALLDEYANYTCRFHSRAQGKTIYTQGEATSHPYVFDAPPTHVRCHSPIWKLPEGAEAEDVQLDVSANGFDYSGGFQFRFTDNLEVY